MDVDPDSDNGEDAGAIEVDLDTYEGDGGDEEDSDDSTSLLGRLGKRRCGNPAAPKPSNLHPDDPANLLKLCTALKNLVARQITDDQIDTAQKLLEATARSLCLYVHACLFLHCHLLACFSCMDQLSSDRIITIRSTSRTAFVTMGHFTSSGRFCLNE